MVTYNLRRKLTVRELAPAVGAGVGAGVVVAYLVQLLLRRERVHSPSGPPSPPRFP